MGYHYVPQEYLRGFADPTDPDMIWMYDKQTGRCARVSIKRVAQQEAYYSDEVERQLAQSAEGPANIILKKLRAGGKIDPADRADLAFYIGTMLMRVPRRRRKAKEMWPGVVEDTASSVRAKITELARAAASDPAILARRLTELDHAIEKYRIAPPSEVVEHIQSPWPSEKIMTCITLMTWRLLPATSATGFFLTSDNPAFFFEGDGLANPESELTFPLSFDLALFCSWQGAPQDTIVLEGRNRAITRFVREANRRVASGAERFVFYRSNEDWVQKVAREAGRYHLNRIVW